MQYIRVDLGCVGDIIIKDIIQLLEELRRDSPNIHDRVDLAAERLGEPADPQAMIETIKHSASRGP